ncbi:unnamed protein product [Cyprideis torosa]|uniref:RNA helicase n=1 Tax=Cyprideis torosa TaxID=163714 RepID=A0A7R8WFB3_9CRUS|nr:unnamed protein product [Cyprideis torosa]CAG0890725.1 unnamed protein product [Cyprideis torosa]
MNRGAGRFFGGFRGRRGGRGGGRREVHGSSSTASAGSDGGGGFGRGRGGGGGRPPGLRGREIGLWYASRGKKRKEESIVKHMNKVEMQNYDAIAAILDEAEENQAHEMSDFQKRYHTNTLASVLSNQGPAPWTKERSSNPVKDEALRKELESKLNSVRTAASGSYSRLQEFRMKLPAFHKREEILSLLEDNQVVVISGETGCGKTTQIPQFILDDWILKGRGSECRVVVTQPRRISAIAVADRVAQERGEKMGQGASSVGYQIRLEKAMPRNEGSILYCTTGILLTRLQSDPYLQELSHIVLDEIHERDINSDFTLAIMKSILPIRKDLKLILMSATLNAELFSSYYANAPMIHIPGFTFPVKEYFLEDALTEIGKPLFVSDDCRGRATSKRMYHEKLENYRNMMNSYITRTGMDGSYPRHVMQTLVDVDSETEDFAVSVASELIQHIDKNMPPGAILVFVSGWDKISTLNKRLQATHLNPGNSVIIPLHSLMPTMSQREVFERPPQGKRKIVIATTIAETSITIDDVVYVVRNIDCGKLKLNSFDEETQIQCLNSQWETLANATQRRGRAGRVQDGICYHLFSRARYQRLQQHPLPEIRRVRLEEVCLQIKLLNLGAIQPFLEKVIDPPSEQGIAIAKKMLLDLNALDSNEELTPLGFHLARLPVQAQIGKMLLMGAMFSCLEPIAIIASCLAFKEPFSVPLGMEKAADAAKKRLAGNSLSDHLMLVKAFKAWDRAYGSEKSRICHENFMSWSILEMLRKMTAQFAEYLLDLRMVKSKNPSDPESNRNSHKEDVIRAVITAGLYPNVAQVLPPTKHLDVPLEQYPRFLKVFSSSDRLKLSFHPKSVLSREVKTKANWLVYWLKQKGDGKNVNLFDATLVSPFALLFFGKAVRILDPAVQKIAADDHVTFKCDLHIADVVKRLRQHLDRILEERIANPSPVDWSGVHDHAIEMKILRGIVQLIEEEGVASTGGHFEAPAAYEDEMDRNAGAGPSRRGRWH